MGGVLGKRMSVYEKRVSVCVGVCVSLSFRRVFTFPPCAGMGVHVFRENLLLAYEPANIFGRLCVHSSSLYKKEGKLC